MTYCSLKKELLFVWETAAQAYAEAIRNFARELGAAYLTEYENVKREVEQKRQRSRAARNAFQTHIHRHDC
jgi:hypothetical protein